ncbi:MAG TPA: 3-oxoacyl-[acyl-carrier-protein] synthase III C-terminal domain-containing protein [Anaerolineales bacterium]|nr:3-oxoacyl-[acyl-carrier-protein] synthase III C-terminal domain-containing protein [Anaerolineales bacterium]
MGDCYITSTGAYLPGNPIDNESIQHYLGKVLGEGQVRDKILHANGIESRHYALDKNQNATHSLYELASEAVKDCLSHDRNSLDISYLSAGTTLAPLLAPGVSSLLHDQLSKDNVLSQSLEINSNSGICTSGAQAIVNGTRAVKSGDSDAAICIGVEQASDGLKSKKFRTEYDIPTILRNVRKSKWFMSVFLRFMLSDGAGAFLLEGQPSKQGHSLKVNWTYSRSFANEAPLCMQIQSRPMILSQNIRILARYMAPLSKRAVAGALHKHGETLDSYAIVLPHMSSYYFEPSVIKIMSELSPNREVPYWTNLRTAGNTGAASIYIMLDEYMKTKPVKKGDRILLFVPESGQFNYVLVSLTVV